MNWKDYIESNDNVLVSKPCIIGTRISVEHIIKLLASGWTDTQILENYPRLTRTHLQAVFSYLNEMMQDNFIYNKTLLTT